MKTNKLGLPHLLLLIAILAIGVNLFLPVSAGVQFEMIVGFVTLYISFSLLHHYLDKSLTIESTLEYILIAALVLLILLSVQR